MEQRLTGHERGNSSPTGGEESARGRFAVREDVVSWIITHINLYT